MSANPKPLLQSTRWSRRMTADIPGIFSKVRSCSTCFSKRSHRWRSLSAGAGRSSALAAGRSARPSTKQTGPAAYRSVFMGTPAGFCRNPERHAPRRAIQLPAGWNNRLELPAWRRSSAFRRSPCAQCGRGDEARALLVSHLGEACRPPSSGDCHIQFTLVALQTQFDLVAGFQADQACDQRSLRLDGLIVDLEQSVPRLDARFGRRAFRLHTVDDDGAGALLRAKL